jgi:hypothetical protein
MPRQLQLAIRLIQLVLLVSYLRCQCQSSARVLLRVKSEINGVQPDKTANPCFMP